MSELKKVNDAELASRGFVANPNKPIETLRSLAHDFGDGRVPQKFPDPFPVDPIGLRLVVFPLPQRKQLTTASGIILPQHAEAGALENEAKALVVAKTADTRSEVINSISVGDIIYMNQFANNPIVVKSHTYLILHESDIYAKVTGDTEIATVKEINEA